jgi:hypothetical protein
MIIGYATYHLHYNYETMEVTFAIDSSILKNGTKYHHL